MSPKIQALANKNGLLAGTQNGLMLIDPEKIVVTPHYNFRDKFNPDQNKRDADLVHDMARHGFRKDEPVVVYAGQDGLFHLVAGHRRRDAALAVRASGTPLKGVWAILEPEGRTEADRFADLIHSNNGVAPTIAEMGVVFQRLRTVCQWSLQDIAAEFNVKTTGWIKEAITLSNADPRLKDLVKQKVVSPTNAILLNKANKGDAEKTVSDIKKAAAASKDGKATEASLRKVGAKTRGSAAKTATPPAAPPVSVLPEKPARTRTSDKNEPADLVGPFHVGKDDLTDCTIFDSRQVEVAEYSNNANAKLFCLYANLGFSTMKGRPPVGTDAAPANDPEPAAKRAAAKSTTRAARKTAK